MSSPMSETVERHRSAFARDWSKQLGAAVSDERAPWPQPEVSARPAADEELPASARRLAAKAETAGWRVAAFYARGTTPHGASWEPGAVVDTVSVRAARSDQAVVGYWRAGKFVAGFVGSRSDGLRRLGSRELAALVASTDGIEHA